MSGGRHKVFGHPALHIVPQTSTIASHLPRAVGLGYAAGPGPRDRRPYAVARGRRRGVQLRRRLGQPLDGDRCAQRGVLPGPPQPPLPGAVRVRGQRDRDQHPLAARLAGAALRSLPGVAYREVDGADPEALLAVGRRGPGRRTPDPPARRPAPAHRAADGPRRLGRGDRLPVAQRDRGRLRPRPAAGVARACWSSAARSPDELLDRYEATRRAVMDEAARVLEEKPLASRAAVMTPIAYARTAPSTAPPAGDRTRADPGPGHQRHARRADGGPPRGAGLR